jgi:hypothetical protein
MPIMSFLLRLSRNRLFSRHLLILVCCGLARPSACLAQAQWVHFGTNGSLVYYNDDLTNHLIDYSYSGYEEGGVAIPTNITVEATVSAIGGDNTANIQSAINTVSGFAANGSGIRGVVLLNPGTYEMDGTLSISTGGVILRGSGTNNTILNFSGTPSTSINVSGSSGMQQVSGSSTYTITDAYVPLGATNIGLNSVSGLSVGTAIVVRRPWTQTWINAIGMSNYWTASGHQNDAERKITAINGNRVTVDIALPTPIEQKWVNGTVFPYTDSGRVQQCGVENMTMVSLEGGGTGDPSYPFGATGINLGNCKNCWVRNIAFSGYGVAINTAYGAGSKWCTAQDCTYANGVNNGSARPAAFQAGGQMCLFQRLIGLSGFEHFLQSDDYCTGPNAFLNCYTTGSDFDGGPHRYWAVSLLTDNESGTVGNVHIVIITGGDNGWGAGYTVFYNCHVNNFTIEAPAVDHTYNWWIGGSGNNTNPGSDPGIYDTPGTTVAPNSLYLEQLKERLGGAAIENIGYQLFSVAASPASETVSPGSNIGYSVNVGDPTSMENTVALSVTGLPSGATAGFSTNSVTGAGSSTLTISTLGSTPVGIYPLNVIGTSAGLTHTSVVSLVVGNPSFSMSASPASQTVIAGSGTNYAVNVVTNPVFTGNVTFGLSGLPANTTFSFNPPSVTSSSNSTLTVTTTASTPLGSFPLTITGTNSTLTNTFPVILAVNSSVVNNPGAYVWNGTNNISANTNWSTSVNWSPAGPPGSLGDAKFFDLAAVGAASNINNVVDSGFTVNSLQYGNTNGFHTTLINPGQTLTVGGLTVGTETDNTAAQSVFATITGPGGALNVNNVNSNLVVRQGTAGSSGGALRATLDMSGLDTFTATIARVEIGTLGSFARPSGTLYLAKTNFITASGTSPAILMGGGGAGSGNGGNGSFFYLGQSNAIFANGISVATAKQVGCSMLFNPAVVASHPVAYFRAADGVSPVPSWLIADSGSSGGTVNTSGTNDFTGGTVNALATSMIVARTSSSSSGIGNPAAVLTFNGGSITTGTLQIAVQNTGTNIDFATGTVNVNGTGLLVVSTNLELAATNGGPGAATTSGTLNITGGTVEATNIFGGGGMAMINLNSGTLDLQGTNSRPGKLAAISTLAVGFTGESGVALLTNAASLVVSNTITIASNGVVAGNTVITAPGLVVDGTISPGGSGIGAITNNGTVTLGAGGNYAVAVQNTSSGPAVGWDFLQTAGAINVLATGANPFTIRLESLANGEPGNVTNFNAATNYDWVIAMATGGISNFASNKFAVDDSQFQNDLTGGYFYVRTNGNSLLLSFTNNHPPVAGTITLYQTGNPMAIPVASLMPHWSDPDGDPVALALVDANSANGANNVGTDGTYIYYTNMNSGADTIFYTVEDVRTNPPAVYRLGDTVLTVDGTVLLLPPPAISSIAVTGTTLSISGSGGITNGTYSLLMSTNIALPLNQWLTAVTNLFDGAGHFSFTTNLNSTAPQDFYRLAAP